jgi:hypothetical protein
LVPKLSSKGGVYGRAGAGADVAVDLSFSVFQFLSFLPENLKNLEATELDHFLTGGRISARPAARGES